MAGIDFRLFLVLTFGCALCLQVTADWSEENGVAHTQVDGGGAADASSDDDLTDPADIEEANSYLSQFGYYDDDDDNEPRLRSAGNVERAIALMQYKAHIPVTGRLNRDTIAMMRQPRCGNKDFNGPSDRLRRRRRRYSLSGLVWPKKHLTYKFVNYTPDLGRETTRSEIRRAFQLWSRAANINFKEVTGTADIDLRFAYGKHGDGYKFDGRGGVLAHAFFPGQRQLDGDAHFDEIEQFTSNSGSGTNLFMVAAHEFGHSLGLGHSDVESSMMAPIYQGYRHGVQLHRDDIAAIQTLYGRRVGAPPPDPNLPPRPPITPTEPGGRPTTPTCNIRVSALMTSSPNNLLAFRNDEYWHIVSNGQSYSVAQGYPQKFSSRFRATMGGGRTLSHIDAAYRRTDGSLRFFKGREFFDFSTAGEFLQRGDLISLFRRRQRSRAPTSVDAAVIVPNANNMVYLFKGRQYWRLNDEDSRVDFNYPQPLSKWSPDLPAKIDGAFFAADSVYFASGTTYQRFIWDGYRLEPGSSRLDRSFFGCGRLQDGTLNVAGSGQASSRTVRNWALVPTMLTVSIALAARHLIFY